MLSNVENGGSLAKFGHIESRSTRKLLPLPAWTISSRPGAEIAPIGLGGVHGALGCCRSSAVARDAAWFSSAAAATEQGSAVHDDDERAQPHATDASAGHAHHRDDLLNSGWIRGIRHCCSLRLRRRTLVRRLLALP